MSLDFNRLRRPDWIVGGGAVALFIVMFFFDWYGGSSNVGTINGVNISGGASLSGWDSFTNSRWIWLITIIVAIAAVLLAAAHRELDLPVSAGAIVAGLGGLSSLLILYRIIHHPHGSATVGTFHASYGIKFGIWLGLIAALAITYGGYLQMQEHDTTTSDVPDRSAGAAPGASAPPGGSPGFGGAQPAAPSAPAPSAPPPSAPAASAPPPSAPAASAPAPSASPPIPPPATPPRQDPGAGA